MRPGIPYDPALDPPLEQDALPTGRELLPNGTAVLVSRGHRFGTDSLLLARFCRLRRQEKACDLGTGCGVIPLYWHDAGHRGLAAGLEISPAGAALLAKAAESIPHITALCGDLRTLGTPHCPPALAEKLPAGSFDLVSCNPPYFTGGFVSEKPGRAAARHALTCTLTDAFAAAAYLLRDRGSFCICCRPERLAEAFAAAAAARLEPKRLQLVRPSFDDPPRLFLLDCRKNARPGLLFEPDIAGPVDFFDQQHTDPSVGKE